ncbi:MAG TPA: sulfite exporter TauE/SafE family protein [Gemmatimonadaceae bacterium]|nr:sulfite exporter TauE/SafE family protein [Gemmatimonadaceae bacterium]
MSPDLVSLGPGRFAIAVLAAAVAGAVNAIAGGGTLLTFPALIALGLPPIAANATSTVALWPGSASSFWGYRSMLAGMQGWVVRFAVPSLAGGLLGAWLLLRTPARDFELIVPWLVFGATALFLLQRPIVERLTRGARSAAAVDDSQADAMVRPTAGVLLFQFAVSIYGGYFGAGMGILMLAALGIMGFANIHRMNALKTWGAVCANAVAAVAFVTSGLVDWPVALAMAVGAIAGGYGGALVAQRVPQRWVRHSIVLIGLGTGIWLLAGGG